MSYVGPRQAQRDNSLAGTWNRAQFESSLDLLSTLSLPVPAVEYCQRRARETGGLPHEFVAEIGHLMKLSNDALELLRAAHIAGGDLFRMEGIAPGTLIRTGSGSEPVPWTGSRARYALEELERVGFVKQVARVHYVVTVDGRDFVEAQTGDGVAGRSASAREIDDVTGIGNRAYLNSASREIFAKCRAEDIPCAAFFLDADDFKSFNARYGHSVGDEVLRAVAQNANQAIRLRGGVVGRWGAGDEIVATMSNLTRPEVSALGERIRETMSSSPIDGRTVTVSIGVASGAGIANVEELWARADQALRAAKKLGKNRVFHHSERGHD